MKSLLEMLQFWTALCLVGSVLARRPDLQRRQTVTLAASANAAPTILPTIYDPTAPDSQKLCPGYVASQVQTTASGLIANLDLAGEPCRTYGNDIDALQLVVEYQSTQRLRVSIQPRYLSAANVSVYVLPEYITGLPSVEPHSGDDLSFEWSNHPSFQFRVIRNSNADVVFDTYGSVLVFQDQFLDLVTNMPADYNVYGLAENIHDFRLGNNYTQTFWAASDGNAVDSNEYGTHPMYLETRYNQTQTSSLSHGVYGRNAHGQEWLLRNSSITYRTIGGSVDLYFLSGPQPKDVIAQYQTGIVGTPVMQNYWALGFHQCRWGYNNWTQLQSIVNGYRDAEIPLEAIWTDIDAMQQYRDFTNDGFNFPIPEGRKFIASIHANHQHYVPIVDANIYAPNPGNLSDAYSTFTRGASVNAYIREDQTSFYYGDQWPGFSTFPDWTVPQTHDFWTGELTNYYEQIPFDGLWLDLSEANSYCVGSCGEHSLQNNPIAVPFALPGQPGNIKLKFPAGFDVTNATEASSASAELAAISTAAASSAQATSARPVPTAGFRNLNFPPYTLNNVLGALVVSAISPSAIHNDEHNSTGSNSLPD
jgi:alpha-glucosidase